jgi:hypothetical protein
MEIEISKLFDGIKKIKAADEAIKKIAYQNQISWGNAVRTHFQKTNFSLSQLEKVELRNVIETLEYLENAIS